MNFLPVDDKLKRTVESDPASDEDSSNEGLQQTLNLNFSPEDREKIRKALEDFARAADPEHDKIEERRRAMQQSIENRFFDADTNDDGTLDRQEATANLPQIARHFNSVDTNQDGLVSLTELIDAQARILERRKAVEAAQEAARQQEILEQTEATMLPKRRSKQANTNSNKKPAL